MDEMNKVKENENKIPISEEMSDELKSAINYLNDHNIGLDDKIEEPEDSDDEIDDFSEGNAEDFSDVDFSDDIEEEDVDTDEIDSLF